MQWQLMITYLQGEGEKQEKGDRARLGWREWR